jgi:hypothetical protein
MVSFGSRPRKARGASREVDLAATTSGPGARYAYCAGNRPLVEGRASNTERTWGPDEQVASGLFLSERQCRAGRHVNNDCQVNAGHIDRVSLP